MKTIKTFKKEARARSKSNGTSYQGELDNLARAEGFSHWGPLQQSLRDSAPTPSAELADLLHALEVVRNRPNCHLAVLRDGDPEQENRILGKLRKQLSESGEDISDIEFFPQLTNEIVARANKAGLTLIATSSGHNILIPTGNFIVTKARDDLGYHNSIYSGDTAFIDQTLSVTKAIQAPETAIYQHVTFLSNWDPAEHEYLLRKKPADYFKLLEKAADDLTTGQDRVATSETRSFLCGLMLLYSEHARTSNRNPSISGASEFLQDLRNEVSIRFETGHDNFEDYWLSTLEARLFGLDNNITKRAATQYLHSFSNADGDLRTQIIKETETALQAS